MSDRKKASELNEEMAAEDGTLIECGCCFGDYAFEGLVQCSEGHLFCKECLARHTEQTMYGNGRTTLRCMSTTGSGCSGFFAESMLQSALPPLVYSKYAEAQSRDVIKAASLENIVVCHSCSMLAELTLDAGKVLMCPRCNASTCRYC